MSKRNKNPKVIKKTKKKKIKSVSASRTKKSATKVAVRGRRGKSARSVRMRTTKITRARTQPKKKKKQTVSKRRTGGSKKFFVRIFGSGQYTVSKNTLSKLNKLDNNIVALLKKEEDGKVEGKFREVVSKMVSIVKKEGKPLPHEQIVPSHAIIPDQQITLEEARQIFSEEGAVPEHLVF